ncbi:MEDS domain-containing protein [Nocardioides sp. STR2]|uniref:MEDS domain-containing protein n=1 Tax=Nocardioides pini TaxID=2975053 RepID=A0ABT4CL26_9ACTN|nr:MEDS domain-containing protein [Nocardioides pini]MCY4728729.1 MEDS domain-containing protein [Nocardioides pini]
MTDRVHEVAAYDEAASLVDRVAAFVADSLEEGVPVVTVSRPAHRRAVDALLAAQAVDVDRARRDGRLTTLDADETMARLLVDGRPDPDLFAELVASLVPADGQEVSAFGEMVAILWEQGEVAAALELESLWNAAIAEHPVRLLCAYPSSVLSDAELGDVARMCGLHDHVSLAGPHPGPAGGRGDDDVVRSGVHLPVPAAVGSVRGFVRDALAGWGLDHLVGDAVLITSELATNAVTHGDSPFRASLVRTEDAVRVSVEDGSHARPELHHALPGDLDGRGMAIVAMLSRRNGCDSTAAGKVTWAELSA